MQQFDTIIENGFVVDGTGCPGTYHDVGIIDGRISELGNLKGRNTKQRIDASGKIVAPGHVTNHTHYDAALFWDPYCSNSGENGVTTIVNANCGFGIAPVREQDRERIMGMLSTTEQIPVAHQRTAVPWNWESFPEYLERIRSIPKGVNVMTFLPLNPLLVYVMGVEAAKTRRPTDSEMQEIHRLINEAMDAGAIGISMSVMGTDGNSHLDVDGGAMPTDALDHDVILEIGRAVVERGEGVIQMLSQIVMWGDPSITEKMVEMTKGTGVRVIHNAFITMDAMPQQVDTDIALMDKMRASGGDVTAMCVLSRAWIEGDIHQLDVFAGQLPVIREVAACQSDEELMALLKTPEFVPAFTEQYANMGPTTGAAGLDNQTILDVGDNPDMEKYLNRTIGEVAEETGKEVVATLVDLVIQSNLQLQLKSAPTASTDPDLACKVMRHSAIVGGGSDGGAHTKSFGLGHYATDLLIWLVREEKRFSLEEMHFQLSLKAARSVQLVDRGALLPGYHADILIYDLDELYHKMDRYQVVHDMPNGDWRRKANAGGYACILVNGEVTHENDQSTGKTPGELVRVTGMAGNQHRGKAA